jgi:hypothetical protein
MQAPEPQQEHLWLQKLVGEWTMEAVMNSGPDQPETKHAGRETVRSVGELWTVGEGRGEAPGGGMVDSIMTLGYDPRRQKFVGTFIASCMTHLWPYEGTLDATGRVLTLDSEGPGFSEDGELAKYQDIIEFITDDHRTLKSQVLGPDGQWTQFMTAHYRRQK